MTDLYVLIMYLVHERKVLSFDDSKDKIDYYMQDKYKVAMNQYLNEYKKKLQINYKPNVYELTTEDNHTYYVVAYNENQARNHASRELINPNTITICDLDLLMTKYNHKGEEINLTIKQLRDNSKVPNILGGF